MLPLLYVLDHGCQIRDCSLRWVLPGGALQREEPLGVFSGYRSVPADGGGYLTRLIDLGDEEAGEPLHVWAVCHVFAEGYVASSRPSSPRRDLPRRVTPTPAPPSAQPALFEDEA